jgi:hypothetical protein
MNAKQRQRFDRMKVSPLTDRKEFCYAMAKEETTMLEGNTKPTAGNGQGSVTRKLPESLGIAKHMQTTDDLNKLMRALCVDTLEGTVTPQQGQIICRCTSLMHKTIDTQFKYGNAAVSNTDRVPLLLVSQSDTSSPFA